MNMTNNPKQKQIREEVAKEIDFLSDHWVNGDDKPPFNFGGWREEVLDTIMAIFAREQEEILARFYNQVQKEANKYFIDPLFPNIKVATLECFYGALEEMKIDLTTQLPEEKK